MKIGHTIDAEGFLTGDVLTGGTPDVTEICPDGFNKPKWDGSAWIEGALFDLSLYKIDKITALSAICMSEILADFTSSALGTVYTYGFDEIDQRNIQSIGINLAIDTTLASVDWKTRESVSMITHTRDQMIQVIKDAAVHQKTPQYKYLNLKAQVLQALDKPSVDAIAW